MPSRGPSDELNPLLGTSLSPSYPPSSQDPYQSPDPGVSNFPPLDAKRYSFEGEACGRLHRSSWSYGGVSSRSPATPHPRDRLLRRFYPGSPVILPSLIPHRGSFPTPDLSAPPPHPPPHPPPQSQEPSKSKEGGGPVEEKGSECVGSLKWPKEYVFGKSRSFRRENRSADIVLKLSARKRYRHSLIRGSLGSNMRTDGSVFIFAFRLLR